MVVPSRQRVQEVPVAVVPVAVVPVGMLLLVERVQVPSSALVSCHRLLVEGREDQEQRAEPEPLDLPLEPQRLALGRSEGKLRMVAVPAAAVVVPGAL